MKTLILIILFSLSVPSMAGEILKPFLEGQSNYVDHKDYNRSQKFFKSIGFLVGLEAEKIIEAGIDGDLISIVDALELAFQDNRKDERKTLENVITICRYENRIDDVLYRLLLDTVKAKYPSEEETETPGAALSLNDYLKKKASLKKMSVASGHPEKSPFPVSKFSFTVGKYRNLSAHEMIYYSYSASQVRSMSKIISHALNVMDAESVVTTVTFRDPSEKPLVLVHTAADQYRLAIRLMKMEKSEAERDSFRIGRSVKNIDLIISAYLMGVISHEELSLVVHDDNFYRPEVSMEMKVLKFAGQLALLGLKLHPVTAPYVIIPILIYNTYAETKKLSQKVDEDSFLFTLPGDKK